MATISAIEARIRLYNKCEEELQGLFSKIEAAIDKRKVSLVYDSNLDELQQRYLKDSGYDVKQLTWGGGIQYEIKW